MEVCDTGTASDRIEAGVEWAQPLDAVLPASTKQRKEIGTRGDGQD
jgi:hypothetical protein